MIIGLPELALHPTVDLPTYVRRIGPVLWDPTVARLPSWVLQVGGDRPAVLVSNSTTDQDDLDLITKLVGSLRGSELEIIVTATGAGTLPDLGVRLAEFIPHSVLIPRVKAVVCSAGYGTVTKAACSGIPLVLVPRAKDQFVVAAAAELAGIAIVELPEAATPARLGAAVRRLLSEPGFADRTAILGRVAQGYSASATAAELIEQAIQTSRTPTADSALALVEGVKRDVDVASS
jgi:UDP:flavonoid glycosyltransferase YjiC (YdhE family)